MARDVNASFLARPVVRRARRRLSDPRAWRRGLAGLTISLLSAFSGLGATAAWAEESASAPKVAASASGRQEGAEVSPGEVSPSEVSPSEVSPSEVSPSEATAPGKTPDLRMAIDVSGSMKHNDPANLRASALDLLVTLLPERSHAGVWGFGEQVQSLLALGAVDAGWKRSARGLESRLDDYEQYTDLEAGLRAAAQGNEA